MIRTELVNKFESLNLLEKIKINGSKHKRKVQCFCGKEIKRTVVPHIREAHSQIWKEWKDIFIYLMNEGYSSKKIIEVFKADDRYLFSWSVVEKEIRKDLEDNPNLLTNFNRLEVKQWYPVDFELEKTTTWSFPKRGTWAVHDNVYRGNWPPQLVRNLLIKYTEKGDKVVDIFAGGGTTLIESWLLKRKAIGIDISPISQRIISLIIYQMRDQGKQAGELETEFEPEFILGDSRDISHLLKKYEWDKGEVDLICAHPPYLDALDYSESITGDLSNIKDEKEFFLQLEEILRNAVSCLKPKGILTILIGDVRKGGELIPLGAGVIELVRKIGLRLREIIIKEQHKDTSTNLYVTSDHLDYLIAHEYLIVSEKIENITSRTKEG